MAGKDKKLDIGTLLKNNASQALLVAMIALLVVRIALFVTEKAPTVEPPPVVPTITLAPTLGPDNPNYNGVIEMTQSWPPFPESEFRQLGELNMFDPQRVLNAENIERRAQDVLGQAKTAFERRDLTGALELVNQALELHPAHTEAKHLKSDIEQMRATGTVAPVPTPEADEAAVPGETGATPPVQPEAGVEPAATATPAATGG